MVIFSVKAREILDSRGNPTVEVEIEGEDGAIGVASVPSGASTGSNEAVELRDGDRSYCHGKGVTKAVEIVNTKIADAIIGLDATNQSLLDKTLVELDGSENKSNLGANAILATSLAALDLAAISHEMPLYRYIGGINANILPCPMINIINGGKHADNGLDIQEFMIMPTKAETFKQAVMNSASVFHTLKAILSEKGLQTNVGDEGGFAPQIHSTTEAIEFLLLAIEKSGFRPGEDFVLALDCAASEFFDNATRKYHLKGEKHEIDSDELIDKYGKLLSKYPIFSIEDPMCETDEYGFKKLTKTFGHKVQIVGDDLFVTNPAILSYGIANNMANGLLVKPNQIGTITETLESVRIAKDAGYSTIISHRSGETEDTKIAHIAVGLNAGQIKTGSLCRTDRTAKYNELLRIEEQLDCFEYAGKFILNRFNNFQNA